MPDKKIVIEKEKELAVEFIGRVGRWLEKKGVDKESIDRMVNA